MEAKELRIGNIIKRKGIIVNADHQSFYDLIRYPDQYEPIPLTEDWLFRFGFDWDSDIVNEEIGHQWYEFKSLKLDLVNNNFVYVGWQLPVLQIKYVHQLQNLYFALTGEELNLKNE